MDHVRDSPVPDPSITLPNPIRHHQPRHARELAAVGRHQGGAPAAGLSRDETVIGADRRALALQISADVASVRGVFRIEWKDGDPRRQKFGQQTIGFGPPVAARVAITQFKQRDGGQTDLRSEPQLFRQTMPYRGNAAVDDVNRDVGIEADHSSKKTRGSGSTGGSSGIPSGRKSRPPSSSRRANHASASNGCFVSGSRITLSPTLLTRTSVPSKRNSLGRRTAWLRPCMNSLAVALMIRLLQNVGRYHWYISRNQRICQFIQQRRQPRAEQRPCLDDAAAPRRSARPQALSPVARSVGVSQAGLAETPPSPGSHLRCDPTSPRERGEVKEALHRQPIRFRQFLERHLRSRADVLDHFSRRERAEPPGSLMA